LEERSGLGQIERMALDDIDHDRRKRSCRFHSQCRARLVPGQKDSTTVRPKQSDRSGATVARENSSEGR
jgi:hypothetical protein